MTYRSQDIFAGDEVAVRDPQRLIAGCVSIIGTMVAPLAGGILVDAEVVYPYRKGPKGVSSQRTLLVLRHGTAHRRVGGTPISRLSGRPGHAGFAEFSRIARSWGHD